MNRLRLVLLAGAIALLPGLGQAQQRFDILIRGGTVIDGTGAPGRTADVGIVGDRIVFIGAAGSSAAAKRTIDAKGLIVAPGFIDPHTHTAGDLASPQRKSNLNYLMQGVTTVVTNNDGGGGVNIGKQLGVWETNGIGTNAAVYIGQGSVRGAVMGMSDAKPTPAQLDSMKKLVARGMDEGAIGISTGLYYAPGSYASTEEVIELAKVAASKGGRYDSHIRDESSYTPGGVIGAVGEVIRIGRETHMPVHISHIKALGVDVWGQSDTIIKLMKRARAEGVAITAAQYPYTASGTSVGASLLPRWAEVDGRDSLVMRIKDPVVSAKLAGEMAENMRRRGGANTLLITGGRDTTIRGKRLDEVARMWNSTPIEAAMRIIVNGDASVASFNMDEKDIVAFMVQDFISTDSDGSDGHPRKYGTFPKLFHEYVGQKHVLTMPQAVRRSSLATAQMMGFRNRGEIGLNDFADVIVFDAATFADRSTYEQPTLMPVGMKYVLVNGVVSVDNGQYAGVTAGRVLRRQ